MQAEACQDDRQTVIGKRQRLSDIDPNQLRAASRLPTFRQVLPRNIRCDDTTSCRKQIYRIPPVSTSKFKDGSIR